MRKLRGELFHGPVRGFHVEAVGTHASAKLFPGASGGVSLTYDASLSNTRAYEGTSLVSR